MFYSRFYELTKERGRKRYFTSLNYIHTLHYLYKYFPNSFIDPKYKLQNETDCIATPKEIYSLYCD